MTASLDRHLPYTPVLLASSDFASNYTLLFLLELCQIIECDNVLVVFICLIEQDTIIGVLIPSIFSASASDKLLPFLIGVRHSINLSASASDKLLPLLVCTVKVRHVRALLHCSPLADLIDPLLESWELRQIDLQQSRTTVDPRVAGDVGDCVLRACKVGAFLQTVF